MFLICVRKYIFTRIHNVWTVLFVMIKPFLTILIRTLTILHVSFLDNKQKWGIKCRLWTFFYSLISKFKINPPETNHVWKHWRVLAKTFSEFDQLSPGYRRAAKPRWGRWGWGSQQSSSWAASVQAHFKTSSAGWLRPFQLQVHFMLTVFEFLVFFQTMCQQITFIICSKPVKPDYHLFSIAFVPFFRKSVEENTILCHVVLFRHEVPTLMMFYDEQICFCFDFIPEPQGYRSLETHHFQKQSHFLILGV